MGLTSSQGRRSGLCASCGGVSTLGSLGILSTLGILSALDALGLLPILRLLGLSRLSHAGRRHGVLGTFYHALLHRGLLDCDSCDEEDGVDEALLAHLFIDFRLVDRMCLVV